MWRAVFLVLGGAVLGRADSFCNSLAFAGGDGEEFDPIHHPFSHAHTENGSKPLRFRKGCPETQHCLFFKDDLFMNLQLGSDSKGFPTSEDYASPFSVQTGEQLLENS